MARSKTNIIAGAGKLYINDSTSALPEIDDVSGTLNFSTWSDVGFTEGVTLEYEATFQEVRVDGHLGIIKMIPTEESATVTVNIKEADLEKFNYAISASALSTVAAGADQVGQDVLKVGDGTMVEKQLAFVGKSPEGYYRLFHFPIAVANGTVSAEHTNEALGFEASFTVLCNPSATVGERLFVAYDCTALASS